MIKRILALTLIVVMFAIVIYNFTTKQIKANQSEAPVEIEDEDFNGVIYAYPDEDVAQEVSGAVKVNEIAPDFTLESLDGKTISLSDLKGKKVFLNFWTTWCTYCVDEMPAMQEFHEKYGDEVIVLGVNAGETQTEKIQKFVDELGITFPIVLDKDLAVTMNLYQAYAIPTTFFINSEGIIQLDKKVGPMEMPYMEEKLKQLD